MKNLFKLPLILGLFLQFIFEKNIHADYNLFSSPPIVKVIVNGKDVNHLKEVADNAVRLSAKVPIRSFLLVQRLQDITVNPNEDQESVIKSYDIAISPIKHLGLEETSTDASLDILKDNRISYSPTWIVKQEGREYIFEGYSDISKFFTRDGVFLNKTNEGLTKVALHEKKSSSVNFPITTKEDQGQNKQENLVVGIEFSPGANDPHPDLDDKVDNYLALPKCSVSKVELDEVFHDTPGSETLDTIIYDPRITTEIKLAEKSKITAIPWDPNYDLSAGHETTDAKLQDLIRALNPNCLPARFSFIYSGSKRYQKIQYGDKAWE